MPALDGLPNDWIRTIDAVELLAQKIAASREASPLVLDTRKELEYEKSDEPATGVESTQQNATRFSEVVLVSDDAMKEAKKALADAIQQGSLNIFLHHRDLTSPLRMDIDSVRRLRMFSEKSFLSLSNFRAVSFQTLHVPLSVSRSIEVATCCFKKLDFARWSRGYLVKGVRSQPALGAVEAAIRDFNQRTGRKVTMRGPDSWESVLKPIFPTLTRERAKQAMDNVQGATPRGRPKGGKAKK